MKKILPSPGSLIQSDRIRTQTISLESARAYMLAEAQCALRKEERGAMIPERIRASGRSAGFTVFSPREKEKRLAEHIHEALKINRAGTYLHFIGGKPYTQNFTLRAAER